jgi:hypothetical protein
MSTPVVSPTITIRQPAAASQAVGAAANAALVRTPVAPGARRMPPVNRTQKTEFLNIAVWHAPLSPAHAEWPIVETYSRLVRRGDDALEFDATPES